MISHLLHGLVFARTTHLLSKQGNEQQHNCINLESISHNNKYSDIKGMSYLFSVLMVSVERSIFIFMLPQHIQLGNFYAIIWGTHTLIVVTENNESKIPKLCENGSKNIEKIDPILVDS